MKITYSTVEPVSEELKMKLMELSVLAGDMRQAVKEINELGVRCEFEQSDLLIENHYINPECILSLLEIDHQRRLLAAAQQILMSPEPFNGLTDDYRQQMEEFVQNCEANPLAIHAVPRGRPQPVSAVESPL